MGSKERTYNNRVNRRSRSKSNKAYPQNSFAKFSNRHNSRSRSRNSQRKGLNQYPNNYMNSNQNGNQRDSNSNRYPQKQMQNDRSQRGNSNNNNNNNTRRYDSGQNNYYNNRNEGRGANEYGRNNFKGDHTSLRSTNDVSSSQRGVGGIDSRRKSPSERGLRYKSQNQQGYGSSQGTTYQSKQQGQHNYQSSYGQNTTQPQQQQQSSIPYQKQDQQYHSQQQYPSTNYQRKDHSGDLHKRRENDDWNTPNKRNDRPATRNNYDNINSNRFSNNTNHFNGSSNNSYDKRNGNQYPTYPRPQASNNNNISNNSNNNYDQFTRINGGTDYNNNNSQNGFNTNRPYQGHNDQQNSSKEYYGSKQYGNNTNYTNNNNNSRMNSSNFRNPNNSNNNGSYHRRSRSTSYKARPNRNYEILSRDNTSRRHNSPNFDRKDSYSSRRNHKGYYDRKNNFNGDRTNKFYKGNRSYYKNNRSNSNGNKQYQGTYQYNKGGYNNHKKYYKDSKKVKKSYSNSSKSHSSKDHSASKDRSNDAGHYKYKIGETFDDGRYVLSKHLSDGTFGRVLEVQDRQNGNKLYALKVIRAVERYVEAAQTETEILRKIQAADTQNKYKIVRLEQTFKHGENFCMVFEKLGLSLYELLKKNDYVGYNINLIQSFFKQILESIGFLHSIRLTHTDLKPENILLSRPELTLVESNEAIKSLPSTHHQSQDKINATTTVADSKDKEEERNPEQQKQQKKQSSPSSSSSSSSSSSYSSFSKKRDEAKKNRKYWLPVSDEIKIIDFGGATFDDEHHQDIINTRQYRAPEVILGCCKWNEVSDVWSIGCIIMELYSGNLFFPTHQNYEHLAMIEKVCSIIPKWMARNAEFDKLDSHFKISDEQFETQGTYFDWPKHASHRKSIDNVKNLLNIDDILKPEHRILGDLIRKCLTVDPKNRISCADALQHEFFRTHFE